jgi:hypothetical protein
VLVNARTETKLTAESYAFMIPDFRDSLDDESKK